MFQTAVTLCLLNRFQCSWYLGCLARAEKPENGIDNPSFWVLPTHRVPNVSWFFGKVDRSKNRFFDRSTFPKTTKRLVPDGWVGPKSSGCRCHFRGFQLKLFILDIQNFGNGPVVKKLQLFEDAKFSKNPKNHRFYLGDSPSTLGPL